MSNSAARLPDAPEISPAQAEQLVAMARAAARGGGRDGVAALREALEPCIAASNHWVSRLNGWIARGLLIEAASVNRSYPELCRVAHALAMQHDRPAWDGACDAAGVPRNSAIDEPAYRALVDAVADASSIEEYAQRFQVAVLGRQPLAVRVRALQELLAAAPRNDAVRALARRYESEAIDRLEDSCREAAAAGRIAELFDALDAIEGLEWQSHFSAEFVGWLRATCQEAVLARATEDFRALAARVVRAFEARDLMLVGTLEEESLELARRHGTEPTEEFRVACGPAFRWAEEQRNQQRRRAEHAERCEAIRNALDQGYTYGELEQLRGRILQMELGIPDDVEARFGTVQAEWRASKRRRAAMVVSLSALAMAVALGGVAFLAHRLNWREAALQRAQQLGTLVSEGRFQEADRFVAEVEADDEEASSTPEFLAARARLAEERAADDRRRAEVARLLRDAAVARDAGDDAMQRASGSLRLALDEREPRRALTPEERVTATSLARDIDERLDAARVAREKAWRERHDALRRAVADLGDDDARALRERFSADALAGYRDRLRALERDLDALIAELPAQHEDLGGARVLRERVRSSAEGAATAAAAVAEASSAERAALAASTESELLDAARALERNATTLKARAGAAGEVHELMLAAEAAQAVRHWREAVLPVLKAPDPQGRVTIPATRARCEPVLAALEDHVRAHPTTPFLPVAKRWIAQARLVTSAKGTEASDPVGVAAMKAIESTGIMRLRQVELKGGQWAFVREDFPGGVGSLRGLVRNANELTCPPGALGDAGKWKDLPTSGKRDMPPWVTAYAAARERMMAPDATLLDTQVTFLRMLQQVNDADGTERVAQAGAMGILLPAFAGMLWDCEDRGAPPCRLAERRTQDYAGAHDWPRLAIALGEGERVELDSARKQVRKPLLDDAGAFDGMARDAEKAWARDVAEASGAVMVAVLAPAPQGGAGRSASRPIPDGEYAVLRYDAGLQRGVLEPARFAGGVMQSGPASAPPHAPIFRRIPR
jgi:hypothetical protein